MRIRGESNIYNWDSTFTFDYVFYDCTSVVEPKYAISYLILDAAFGVSDSPATRTVTLPNTTGQFYSEYCKPYYFSWKQTATADVTHFANVSAQTNMLVLNTWVSPFTIKTTTPTYPLVPGDMVIPPSPYETMSTKAWITVSDLNTISNTVGPSITMSTSLDADSGRFTLRKELMV